MSKGKKERAIANLKGRFSLNDSPQKYVQPPEGTRLAVAEPDEEGENDSRNPTQNTEEDCKENESQELAGAPLLLKT